MSSLSRTRLMIWCMVLIPFHAMGQDDATVTATASLSPEQIPFHHIARYRIEIEAPRDANIEVAPWAASMPGLSIQRESPVARITGTGRQTVTQDFTLTPTRVRNYELPAVQVLVNAALHTTLPPVRLEVRDLTVEERSDAERLLPLLSLEEAQSRAQWPLGSMVLAVCIAATLLAGGFWFWRKQSPGKPDLMPWERAEQDIDQLVEFLEQRRIRGEAYYTRLSAILRDYIELRFGIETREYATPEIAGQLADVAWLDNTLMEETVRLLRAVDRVKFAQRQPSISEMTAEAAAVRDLVAATRPESMPDAEGAPEERGAA